MLYCLGYRNAQEYIYILVAQTVEHAWSSMKSILYFIIILFLFIVKLHFHLIIIYCIYIIHSVWLVQSAVTKNICLCSRTMKDISINTDLREGSVCSWLRALLEIPSWITCSNFPLIQRNKANISWCFETADPAVIIYLLIELVDITRLLLSCNLNNSFGNDKMRVRAWVLPWH